MATTVTQPERRGVLGRLLSNQVLAGASAILLACTIIAVIKGQAEWARVPVLVWVHLGSIVLATGLTPVMLLRRKGDGRHRKTGYAWVGAMLLTAITSLFFNARSPAGMGVFTGDFSVIHILSVIVLLQVPRIVIKARRHDRSGHERAVRTIVIGALLIAGFFTFPFNRMLGSWLFA